MQVVSALGWSHWFIYARTHAAHSQACMHAYARTHGLIQRFILDYFGDPHAEAIHILTNSGSGMQTRARFATERLLARDEPTW